MSDDRNRRGDDPDRDEEYNLFAGDRRDGEGQGEGHGTQGGGGTPDATPDNSPGETPDDDEEARKAARRAARRARREAAAAAGNEGGTNLPVPRKGRGKKGSALPALRAADPAAPAIRAERVEAIRRDLVRRRRRKGLGVLARLMIFVILPTCFIAWFFWTKASDLYRSEAVFVVQSAEIGGTSTSGGGMLAAFGGGTTDAIAVQNFILSRDVLRKLDEDLGLIAHFRDEKLDWWHRLTDDQSFEAAYEHYQRFVEVSFDPTEGVLELATVAADPDYAQRVAEAIISYAEEMVDGLSDPIRENALKDAEANLAGAEERLKAAQLDAAEVRKQLETFSVEGEFSAEMSIITQMEIELETLRARLTNLERVTGSDDPRVQRLRTQVETMEAQIAARRDGVTGRATGTNGRSLADVNAELERANFEVTAAMTLFTAAIEARELARTDAQRQHRYLSVVVQPSRPDLANYPRKLEMTALAFLVFLGIYIIGSLTISLIREQASI